MRDPKRIKEILGVIEKVWTKYPDLRFIQLVTNIEKYPKQWYYFEDDKFLELFKEFYKEQS